MSEAVTNEPIDVLLQKMPGDLREVRGDTRKLDTRMTTVEEHIGGFVVSVHGLNNRLDRLIGRMERGERRLELAS